MLILKLAILRGLEKQRNKILYLQLKAMSAARSCQPIADNRRLLLKIPFSRIAYALGDANIGVRVLARHAFLLSKASPPSFHISFLVLRLLLEGKPSN